MHFFIITELKVPIILKQINQSYNEPVTISHTFSWQGEKFPLTKQPRIIKLFTNFTEDSIKEIFSYDHIILTPTLSNLNDYLIGTPRFPFKSLKSKYLLITQANDFDELESIGNDLMEKLWKIYGIFDYILIEPCLQVFGYYDTFDQPKNIIKSEWGITKWKKFNEFDSVKDFLNDKFNNFNNYPLRITLFNRKPTAIIGKDIPSTYKHNIILKKSLNQSKGKNLLQKKCVLNKILQKKFPFYFFF